jgi:hypothetical protein
MLSKCANSACSIAFRYLGEGRLYLIDSKAALARWHNSASGLKYVGKLCTYEYFWLCSSCCQEMTIQIDSTFEVKVACKRGRENSPELDISEASAGLMEVNVA